MKVRIGTYQLRMALLRRAAPRSGIAARYLRHPNPFAMPWRRGVVDVIRSAGIGDVLMCTPVLRELKRRRPACCIRFYTDFPTLVRGLPYIDEVLPVSKAPKDAVTFEYEYALPPQVHLTKILGDSIGLRVDDVRPDCTVDLTLVERFRDMWRGFRRPHILLSRHASSWTPNKEWPEVHWTALIRRLSGKATVIEVGALDGTTIGTFGADYIDLRGRTSLDELVAAIAAADISVGPMSGPVHIAAAFEKRAVVILGGYEHPSNTTYPGNISLYSPVECAPCWLREPCPHGRKCLDVISPQQVEDALFSLWNNATTVGRSG